MSWASFDDEDIDIIMGLARELTGTQVNRMQHSVIIQNIASRLAELKCRNLEDYLVYVEQHDAEIPHLLSAVTIHTTSWFREPQAFERFEEYITEFHRRQTGKPFSLLSMACSTGEEVYSFGVLLERFRLNNPGFDYELEGWDIDPLSLHTARQASYQIQSLSAVTDRYRRVIEEVIGPRGSVISIPPAIVKRCRYRRVNLTQPPAIDKTFDQIVCRNVLIYFSNAMIERLMHFIRVSLADSGRFVCGVSETSAVKPEHFLSLGQSTYRALPKTANHMRDSTYLWGDRTAKKPLIQEYDVQALRFGGKPELILFGASTGGTEALHQALSKMPADCPPLMIVQHIAASFAGDFARRLAASAGLCLSAMRDNERLLPGHLYIPLDDYHVGVRSSGEELRLKISRNPPINSHRPSVDHMFHSAVSMRKRVFAALLTGMGKDGAQGLLALRQAGAITTAQSEASSVVFGMPREAIRLGAAAFVGSPLEIRRKLDQLLKKETQDFEPSGKAV
jgi:chemotaxis methyl-accepting protein methylase